VPNAKSRNTPSRLRVERSSTGDGNDLDELIRRVREAHTTQATELVWWVRAAKALAAEVLRLRLLYTVRCLSQWLNATVCKHERTPLDCEVTPWRESTSTT
jgi:hypothetical protein